MFLLMTAFHPRPRRNTPLRLDALCAGGIQAEKLGLQASPVSSYVPPADRYAVVPDHLGAGFNRCAALFSPAQSTSCSCGSVTLGGWHSTSWSVLMCLVPLMMTLMIPLDRCDPVRSFTQHRPRRWHRPGDAGCKEAARLTRACAAAAAWRQGLSLIWPTEGPRATPRRPRELRPPLEVNTVPLRGL